MARQSAAVYRRRRIVVFGGLILVIAALVVGLWAVIARPWAADAAAVPVPTSSPAAETPSALPTSETADPQTDDTAPEDVAPAPEETEEAGVAPCQARDVLVEPVTDADTYAAGQLVNLSISLTNRGAADCMIDVGSSTQSFVVTSGSDTWWRSTDCQQEPSSMVVTLAAGQTVVSKAPVVWDRTRSSVDTCADENRQRAPGGGASYHVAVSIGGFDSEGTRQILLY